MKAMELRAEPQEVKLLLTPDWRLIVRTKAGRDYELKTYKGYDVYEDISLCHVEEDDE